MEWEPGPRSHEAYTDPGITSYYNGPRCSLFVVKCVPWHGIFHDTNYNFSQIRVVDFTNDSIKGA
jgi:hypothetical protein